MARSKAIAAKTLRDDAREGSVDWLRWWREALVFAVLALIGFGFLVSLSIDGPLGGLEGALKNRAMRLLAGLVAFALILRLRFEVFRHWVLPLFVSALFLCLVPRLLGDSTKGAYRWIEIGSTTFQPVELLKIMTVFATAEMLERRRALLHSFWQGVVPIVTVPALAALVLASQPDLGHAFFVLATAGILLACGGLRLQHGLVLMGAALLLLVLLLQAFGHSRHRVAEFASGEPGFQIGRGLRAFAEGGFSGLGPGAGWIKMGHLPEARNDFVLAIVGNEFGLVGSMLVVALFALIFAASIQITRSAATRFEFLIALGASVMLALQACVNVLGVTFTVPEKGIDLPFVSSGGTNLVFALAAIAILLRVGRAGRNRTD